MNMTAVPQLFVRDMSIDKISLRRLFPSQIFYSFQPTLKRPQLDRKISPISFANMTDKFQYIYIYVDLSNINACIHLEVRSSGQQRVFGVKISVSR